MSANRRRLRCCVWTRGVNRHRRHVPLPTWIARLCRCHTACCLPRLSRGPGAAVHPRPLSPASGTAPSTAATGPSPRPHCQSRPANRPRGRSRGARTRACRTDPGSSSRIPLGSAFEAPRRQRRSAASAGCPATQPFVPVPRRTAAPRPRAASLRSLAPRARAPIDRWISSNSNRFRTHPAGPPPGPVLRSGTPRSAARGTRVPKPVSIPLPPLAVLLWPPGQ